jgi:hypothetical protein
MDAPFLAGGAAKAACGWLIETNQEDSDCRKSNPISKLRILPRCLLILAEGFAGDKRRFL